MAMLSVGVLLLMLMVMVVVVMMVVLAFRAACRTHLIQGHGNGGSTRVWKGVSGWIVERWAGGCKTA